MTSGNTLDTFRLIFDNGEELCLIACDATHARLAGMELNPGKKIVRLYKLDLWEDND